MKIDLSQLDSPLLGAEAELEMLADHLQLIENHIERIQKRERREFDRKVEEIKKASKDLPKWSSARQGELADYSPDPTDYLVEVEIASQEYEWRINDLPLFLRGPFLVSLYAVYESVVTEIAKLIRNKQSQKKKIDDLRGNFLDRAKKYYKHILQFDLYSNEKAWQQIRMLSDLRNAFAHANGRVDRLKKKSKKKIKQWNGQKNIGISITIFDHVICDADIVADIFGAVSDSLEDLIKRYKHWDDHQKSHNQHP